MFLSLLKIKLTLLKLPSKFVRVYRQLGATIQHDIRSMLILILQDKAVDLVTYDVVLQYLHYHTIV